MTDTRNVFADEVGARVPIETFSSDAIRKIEAGPLVSRETGDEVNRFFLCSLVSLSAKRIKAMVEEAGERIPMTIIVRSVLRFYRLAAKEKDGPLSRAEPDMAGIRRLNEKVLREEVARHTEERVKSCEARLTKASRLGDDARIKSERDALDLARSVRDRLAGLFK